MHSPCSSTRGQCHIEQCQGALASRCVFTCPCKAAAHFVEFFALNYFHCLCANLSWACEVVVAFFKIARHIYPKHLRSILITCCYSKWNGWKRCRAVPRLSCSSSLAFRMTLGFGNRDAPASYFYSNLAGQGARHPVGGIGHLSQWSLPHCCTWASEQHTTHSGGEFQEIQLSTSALCATTSVCVSISLIQANLSHEIFSHWHNDQ